MRLLHLPKYFLILLLSLTSCKNRDRYLNASDNMVEISRIEEVYATGIPQKVREIFNHYSSLDLSIKKNQEEVADFKDDIYLFREKFIITHLRFYKVYGECGKDAYGMIVSINQKHLEDFDIVLSKTKNGYELCDITKFDLLYSQRKRANLYLKKFKKKYWI
jgi:hypothetical protein